MSTPTSFFFQAEDGIRDHCVTGVQTCALPIFIVDANERALVDDFAMGGLLDIAPDGAAGDPARSEERRVGKECRFRWRRCPSRKSNGRVRFERSKGQDTPQEKTTRTRSTA